MTIRIEKLENVNWQDLRIIQSDSFKSFDRKKKERLKNSLFANNFVQPLNVWMDENNDIWCLDGKHRIDLLKEMRSEGVDIPNKLPAVFLSCNDKKEAALLVAVYSSSYAEITENGLKLFIEENDLDFNEFKSFISLPNLNLHKFEQKLDLYNLNPLSLANNDDFTPDADLGKEVLLDKIPQIVQKNDVFIFDGKHRIGCGDFKDKKLLERLFGQSKARVFFTDPPYNLPSNSFSGKGGQVYSDFAQGGGEMSDEEFVEFLASIFENAKQYSESGGLVYLCMDFRHIWHVCSAGNKVFPCQDKKNKGGNHYTPKQMCVWNKSQAGNGSFYRAKHEVILIYKVDDKPHTSKLSLAERYRSNVWDYQTASSYGNEDRKYLKYHPTPKPVLMVADVALDVSEEKEIIADFFMGSGTTLMAAEATNRVAIGTEIEPKYVQLIIYRYLSEFPDASVICENRPDFKAKDVFKLFE